MIEQLLNVIAPVFIVIAIGWGWAKIGKAYDTELVSSLVMAISAPCLIFSTLSTLQISPHLLGVMGMATALTLLLFGAMGATLLKVTGLPQRGFLAPLMFANIGNMGLPLCLFAFGKPGLALAIVVFAVFCVGQFTFGVWLYSGAASPVFLLKTPIIYAVFLGMAALLAGWQPPGWVAKTTELLGSFTIPLMLLTLGVSLARLEVMNLRRSLSLSALRLGMGFGVGVLVAALMGLTGAPRGVLILQSSMPVAVFNYLLSERYNQNPNETAGLVVISTVLSLLTLPLLLKFLT
jgi:malate permease and related proteins